MSDTTFVSGTSIASSWLNDVNSGIYKAAGGLTGAVSRSAVSKFADSLSVKDYGAVGDGTTDDTAAILLAIAAGIVLKRKVYFPAATYKVTSQISLPPGSQLIGDKGEQYNAGFLVTPGATIISFQPTVASTNLFVATGTGSGGFRFHYSIEGFYMVGNANAGVAVDWQSVIYGRVENCAAETFATGLRCTATINNRFVNNYFQGSTQAVSYVGTNETTDVFEQCSFWGSPIGVNFAGTSIGIRFTDCLWEQIDTYGMQIAKDCQAITVVNAYAEDVPFTNTATGAMFRVGYTGTTLSSEYQLVVIGGKYSGRNAGTVGSFLDCDSTNGVMLQGVTHSRFTNIIKTTANTRASSINVMGGSGISWTNYTLHVAAAGDTSRLSGVFPNGVNNTGTQSQSARHPALLSDSITAADGLLSAITLSAGAITFTPGAGAAAYPTADNTADLGIDANRWKSLRAGYLRTSAASVAGGASTFTVGGTTAGTVGAAGGASALPATPLGYLICHVAGTQVKIPYYNT